MYRKHITFNLSRPASADIPSTPSQSLKCLLILLFTMEKFILDYRGFTFLVHLLSSRGLYSNNFSQLNLPQHTKVLIPFCCGHTLGHSSGSCVGGSGGYKERCGGSLKNKTKQKYDYKKRKPNSQS